MPPTTSPSSTVHSVIDRFWESVPPGWHRVREHLRATASEQFGITVEQFHILRHVRKGAASVSELAEVKQISRPAISQAVELLVEKGHLARTPDPEDRRRVRLALTATGSALLEGIFRANREWMAARLQAMTPDELAALERGLELFKTFILTEEND